jgi:hypothetical protein
LRRIGDPMGATPRPAVKCMSLYPGTQCHRGLAGMLARQDAALLRRVQDLFLAAYSAKLMLDKKTDVGLR